MSSTLKILSELKSIIASNGYSSKSVEASLLSFLTEAWKSSRDALEGSDYTSTRALALRDLSLKLREVLLSATGASYTDRASVLSSVADNYLKLTHAFKVDSEVWNKAQTELVPLFSAISDEKSLDFAIAKMELHLNTYIDALGLWVSR